MRLSPMDVALAVWKAIPLANRTITLPAGSYTTVVSRQRGSIANAGVSTTDAQTSASISSVSTSKAWALHSGATIAGNNNNTCSTWLNSSTQVTARYQSGSAVTQTSTHRYEVAERI